MRRIGPVLRAGEKRIKIYTHIGITTRPRYARVSEALLDFLSAVAWDLLSNQPDGPPSRDGVPSIPPAKCALAPALNLPARGLFWRLARAGPSMVKITISAKAFAALAATLPLGSVAVEPERAPDVRSGYGSTTRPSQSSAISAVAARTIPQ
jgi:hypothetical protein